MRLHRQVARGVTRIRDLSQTPPKKRVKGHFYLDITHSAFVGPTGPSPFLVGVIFVFILWSFGPY